MAVEVLIPKWGLTMEEGLIAQWLKHEGEHVEKGEPILEVETDKIINEVEAPESGILARILYPAGSTVPVSQVIAIITAPGEPVPEIVIPGQAVSETAAPAEAALETPIPPAPPAPAPEGRVRANPVAKKLAKAHGLDLTTIQGSGRNGTITKADVERALAAPSPSPAPAPAESKAGEELVKHDRIRLLIARNTTRSIQTIPHVTTWHEVNMASVLAHRKWHKKEFAEAGVNLTLSAYLIKATVAGLKAVPEANSSWTDEGLIIKHYYNIGLAVALPGGGLVVPVIKDVEPMSLLDVARAINDLAERARESKFKLEELQEGTFTVSNYGTSGSRFQTPIISGGQAGILGTGAVQKRPVVVSQGHALEENRGDTLAILPMLTLAFSYDHRILDGALADPVCLAIKQALENWE